MNTSSNAWMLQSVRSFWQNVNWENHPIPVATISSNGQVTESVALSFVSSVQQYFNAIPWSGVALVAAPTSSFSSSSELEEPAETLDDFLDDIASFF